MTPSWVRASKPHASEALQPSTMFRRNATRRSLYQRAYTSQSCEMSQMTRKPCVATTASPLLASPGTANHRKYDRPTEEPPYEMARDGEEFCRQPSGRHIPADGRRRLGRPAMPAPDQAYDRNSYSCLRGADGRLDLPGYVCPCRFSAHGSYRSAGSPSRHVAQSPFAALGDRRGVGSWTGLVTWEGHRMGVDPSSADGVSATAPPPLADGVPAIVWRYILNV